MLALLWKIRTFITILYTLRRTCMFIYYTCIRYTELVNVTKWPNTATMCMYIGVQHLVVSKAFHQMSIFNHVPSSALFWTDNAMISIHTYLCNTKIKVCKTCKTNMFCSGKSSIWSRAGLWWQYKMFMYTCKFHFIPHNFC